MPVLSVDLASRRYADNGIAILSGEPGRVRAQCISPESLGLRGAPEAEALADALARLAAREGLRLMLLDGPQGWRANASGLVHQRHCERQTLTPGKTGLPGVVKPKTWTRMAEFSVGLFDALDARGWPRITSGWNGEPCAIESFPTHAWRSLGFTALPGKSATTTLEPWIGFLRARGVTLSGTSPSHDELQAVVAGLAGIALLNGGLAACDVRGEDPAIEDGLWREGLIVSPTD